MANHKTRKKKKWLIGLIVLTVAAVGAGLGIFFLTRTTSDKENKGQKEQEARPDWDNRIADLENEPVSDLDVVYKENKKSTDKPYQIQVNKSQNSIIVYKKDKNGKYSEPYRAMICSVGYDTPVGNFTTSDKYEWKIVNGNVWAQYATRVVGNVLFHSMPYASNSKDTLLPNYYNQLGSTLSASCIRVSARDAEWIMKNCPAGTKVQIYESESEEPMARPKAIVVPQDAVWDPTDPDPMNPYHGVTLAFEGVDANRTVERGTQINYQEGVTIKDTCGNDLSSEVKIITNLDPFKLGTYEVSYRVEDAAGKTAEAKSVYQVVDTAPPQFSGLKSVMNFEAVADVTREHILKGVSVIDNNEILDNSRIDVVIPAIVEGNNMVTLTVTDDFGNTTTVTVTVSVHIKPPVLALKPGTETIIPLTQKVDQAYALSRVTATDNGVAMPQEKISVSITPAEWGYSLKYTVTDENGYMGVLNDSVSYVEYKITVPEDMMVTDINDKSQLLKGVHLGNNLGGSLEASAIQVAVKPAAEGQYQVTYTYTYTSPLGSRTASAQKLLKLEIPVKSDPPIASEVPKESGSPNGGDNPGVSTGPADHPNAATQTPVPQPE